MGDKRIKKELLEKTYRELFFKNVLEAVVKKNNGELDVPSNDELEEISNEVRRELSLNNPEIETYSFRMPYSIVEELNKGDFDWALSKVLRAKENEN